MNGWPNPGTLVRLTHQEDHWRHLNGQVGVVDDVTVFTEYLPQQLKVALQTPLTFVHGDGAEQVVEYAYCDRDEFVILEA